MMVCGEIMAVMPPKACIDCPNCIEINDPGGRFGVVGFDCKALHRPLLGLQSNTQELPVGCPLRK